MIGLLENWIERLGESGERAAGCAGASLLALGLMVQAAILLALLDFLFGLLGRAALGVGLSEVLLLAILIALAQRLVTD